MEKKDIKKLTHPSQEDEASELVSKEEKKQISADLGGKKSQTGSPSHNNGFTVTEQCPPILQWPYTSQPTLKQSPLIPRPAIPTQQSPSTILNQWPMTSFNAQQPPPQQQQNSTNQTHHQHTQPSVGFWLPPGVGLHLAGAAAAQPFAHIGATDNRWQTSVMAGGVTPFRNEQPHIPGLCYQGGYSNSMGFPSTWDPSSWWGQMQQSQPPLSFPGPYGCFSMLPPPVPESSVNIGGPIQRRIILPKPKLSPKHQQMWEAQSSENVQLWAAISQMQSEMTACGSRLMKLEAEISSLKSKLESSSAATGSATTRQALKRRRPKKVASVNMLPSLDKPQPHARRKTAQGKAAQSETLGLNTEKESSNREKEKPCQPLLCTATIQQENELNGSNLKMPLDVQVAATFNSRNSTMEMNENYKLNNQKVAFSISSEHVMGANNEGPSAIYAAVTNNGSHGWALNALSNECRRNLLDIRAQSFYNNVNALTQGGKAVPGWSFLSEDASQEREDAMVGPGKDDGEDASSGADEMDQTKAEGYK